ncbi:MAG: TIM barrel protein [Pseudomonadota bacterium]
MKFSANLGFLWTDRTLPDAVRAAQATGFDAVEFHWPYDTPLKDLQTALAGTGLPVLGLNTTRGAAGENGLSALPGREADARAAIDQAIAYGAAIAAEKIHVMAGFAEGAEADAAFIANLTYAAKQAAERNMSILIEPLNRYDASGYFLKTTDQAVDIIKRVGAQNLKLMFDCYHVQLMEGDLTHRLQDLRPFIGHIQFASVPDRGPPDQGEISYSHLFKTIESLGYDAPLGAEYKPTGATEASLGWLETV